MRSIEQVGEDTVTPQWLSSELKEAGLFRLKLASA